MKDENVSKFERNEERIAQIQEALNAMTKEDQRIDISQMLTLRDEARELIGIQQNILKEIFPKND